MLTSEGDRNNRLCVCTDTGVKNSEDGAEDKSDIGDGVLLFEMEVSGVIVMSSSNLGVMCMVASDMVRVIFEGLM
jgi:hypothetical protein